MWRMCSRSSFAACTGPHQNWPSVARRSPPPVAEAHWGCWMAGPPHYSRGSSRRRSWGCCGSSASLSWRYTGMLERETQRTVANCSMSSQLPCSAKTCSRHPPPPLRPWYQETYSDKKRRAPGSYSKGLLLFNMGIPEGQLVDGGQSCWLDRIPLVSAQWGLLAR